MSRISTAQRFETAQANVSEARAKEAVTSEKAASGRELLKASDNPAGYLSASSLKDQLSRSEAMTRNAQLAEQVLSTTETVIERMQEIMQRSYELALSSSGDGSVSDTSRQLILGEVETLFQSGIQVLNTRFANRTLLAGFKVDQAAFDKTGKFLGDTGSMEVEVAPGMRVPVNISATKAIFGEGIVGGINLIDTMQTFMKGLKENNTKMIQGSIEPFKDAISQMSLVRGEIAAHQSQVTMAQEMQEKTAIDFKGEISRIQDADAIKVFSDLARDQTILKASITTSQKLLGENPADILFK